MSGFRKPTTYRDDFGAANQSCRAIARAGLARLRIIVVASLVTSCSGRDSSSTNHDPASRRDSTVAQSQIARPTEIGQWIWSETDAQIFAESSRSVPELTPTVWIGTVRASRDGVVQLQIALSPRAVGRPRTGIVVRFDDSFTNAFARQPDSVVANAVNAALRSILAAVRASDVQLTELQLDYDCPERLLSAWAKVVSSLSRDALAGESVWVTSLVAHMKHDEYGDLFRAHVAGHILQVFDTGDRMSPSSARAIEQLASSQRMPFRLGVAAFERTLPDGRTTEHRAWFDATGTMSESEWYRGLWVFPGGRRWVPLLNQR